MNYPPRTWEDLAELRQTLMVYALWETAYFVLSLRLQMPVQAAAYFAKRAALFASVGVAIKITEDHYWPSELNGSQ